MGRIDKVLLLNIIYIISNLNSTFFVIMYRFFSPCFLLDLHFLPYKVTIAIIFQEGLVGNTKEKPVICFDALGAIIPIRDSAIHPTESV